MMMMMMMMMGNDGRRQGDDSCLSLVRMRRDRDGGRARKCQELHADLMVIMKERSGVWLGSPSRRLRVLVALGHQPPGHFFGQPVAHSQPVPRWSHDQAVFRHLRM